MGILQAATADGGAGLSRRHPWSVGMARVAVKPRER